MPSLSAGKNGQSYWRSLDELADAPEFRAYLESEFPDLAPALITSPTRRQFLKVMGASLALGGMVGCRWPKETIVPFAKRPAGRSPGEPVRYATAMELGGVGTGLLVTSFDGRPIKIEGNELHPFSLGATDAVAQASVLELYDPDRSPHVAQRTAAGLVNSTWEAFEADAGPRFAKLRERAGEGLFVLSEASSSPSLADMRRQFAEVFPKAEWYEYEPLSRDNERTGTALAFGSPHRTHLNLTGAEVVVSFDDDFLLTHPASIRYTRDFASRRTAAGGTMNRLYVLESTLSLTGSNADVRFAERSSDLPIRLCQLAAELLKLGLTVPGLSAEAVAKLSAFDAGAVQPKYLARIARDLLQNRERGIITVGPRQPAEAHAVAALLNAALANAGSGVRYSAEPAPQRPTHAEAIAALANKLRASSEPQTLLILGANPVYNAASALPGAPSGVDDYWDWLAKSDHHVIQLSRYRDETTEHCTWHLPAAHYLESWGDTRAWDGTVSIVQPLIAPLYGARTAMELLAYATGDPLKSGYEITRRTFRDSLARGEFEAEWRRALHDGLVPDTASPMVTPALRGAGWTAVLERINAAFTPPESSTFEIVFAQDNTLYDGRFANNGWLQELPDPITKLTWDNAALIAPADATRLGVKRNDQIEITLNGRTLTIPVCPVPGHAPGSITLPLGYGRTHGGRVAGGCGFDAYRLRSADGMHVTTGATVRVVNSSYTLATTQDHHAVASEVGEQETRKRSHELVREGTLSEYRAHPDFVKHRAHSLPLVQPFDAQEFPDKPRWAMAIDLAKCTGCSACVVACQAENNVPVVGKDEVLMGREMHWIRLDRYFKGDPEDANGIQVAHQPVACQHCENAPCEQVCPVAATVHDEEGLNVMVYNRCIGTRYCSNNCPYKVRRFNWFWNHHGPAHPRSDGKLRQKDLTAIEKMVFNPDVTVRSRGVMEKCTFCTQRINAVKIDAKNEGRPITDGEIVPACAQVCPAEAIVFGDLNDENSAVRQAHEHNRAYALLEFLNVRPRNVYLANLRNPSDESASDHEKDNEHHATTEHAG